MKSLLLPFALLFAANAASATQPAPTTASPVSTPAKAGEAWDAPLAPGIELLKAGKPQAAIDQVFDPVIAGFEKEYAAEKRQVFCARTAGEALLYMGEANANKQGAIAIKPTWAYAWFYKAYALGDLGRADDANESLKKALALSPSNPKFLSELGFSYIAEHKWQDMLEAYGSARAMVDLASPDADKNDELTRAMRGQGYALTELGRLDEAEARYREALQVDPQDERSLKELTYIAQLREKNSASSAGK